MRDKRGFTLIELLAVIVILAVIALIATPIIMNVINDSKEGAAKDAMYGYIKAVELASIDAVTTLTDAPDGKYVPENGNLKQGSEVLEVAFKGTKPKDNTGEVILSKGNVVEATLEFDGITVHYDGKEAKVVKEVPTPTSSPSPTATPTPPAKTYSIGEEVYFDPEGREADCASGKEWTPDNTETTCYKWNVVKDNGTSIEALLDHNTTAHVAWNSSGDSDTNGPRDAYAQLYNDTMSWNKVETLTSSDNAIRDNAAGGTYTVEYNGLKGRLMGGQEIADIINDTVWTPSDANMSIRSEFSWLYQNLSTSNTNPQPIGYWTDTVRTTRSTHAWIITGLGSRPYSITIDDKYGVRPVVRILKSNI